MMLAGEPVEGKGLLDGFLGPSDEFRVAASPFGDPYGAMMKFLASNGVPTIIVETASRFARDLIHPRDRLALPSRCRDNLIAANSPDAFLDEPTAVMIRQILRSASQFEKAKLVAEFRSAREPKKAVTGKCKGRRSNLERNREAVRLATKLARYPVNLRTRTLR